MTDKELLELAAKAAKIKLKSWVKEGLYPYAGFNIGDNGNIEVWNPLDDDGDALRLAGKLKIDLMFEHNRVNAKYGVAYLNEFIEQDLYAATRRAIVRAAAEIGKGML